MRYSAGLLLRSIHPFPLQEVSMTEAQKFQAECSRRVVEGFNALPSQKSYDAAIAAIQKCGISRKDAVALLSRKYPAANIFREVCK